MNKQLPSHQSFLSVLFSLFLMGNSFGQTFQVSYPTAAGYSIEALGPPSNGEITANLKNGLANAFFRANAVNGNFISLNPAVPDCDPSTFGGDLRVSAIEFFDHSLTATNDLKIRRIKLLPNTCALDQVVFEQTYDLPTAEAVQLSSIVYNASANTVFIAGLLQLNPVGSSTQYRIFVKKINATTGSQTWEYQTSTLTIAGPAGSQNWQLQTTTSDGGVIASKSGFADGSSQRLIKLDGNGQLVYNNPIGSTLSTIRGISEYSDGKVLVRLYSGSFSGPGDNFRAIHWDAAGNALFSIHAGLMLNAYFGGSAFAFLASFDAHVRLVNGDYLLVGKNTGGTGGAIPGAHLSRVSPSGTVLWTRFYPGLLADFTHALESFPDGGFLLGGTLNGELFLMRTDANGNIAAPPVTCAGNLLTNPGFENGLTGWNTAGEVTISTTANSGTKAAKVGGTGYASVGFILPATAGTAYTAKVWAKQTGTGYKAVELRFLNASWAALPGGASQDIPAATYTERTMSGTAPAGTAYVYVIGSKDGNGTLEVDDWCLTSGAPVPTLTITCPIGNGSVIAQPGQNGAFFSFGNTTATSTCTTGSVTVTQTSGLPSGSIFPLGNTEVCFTATDGCGNTKVCCFTVTVLTQAPTCNIAATAVASACNNNGTATNAADDYFTVTTTVTGVSSGWTGILMPIQPTGGVSITGSGNQPATSTFTISEVQPYLVNGKFEILLSDNSISNCYASVS